MSTNRSNVGALVGGSVLIGLGLLTLAGEFFSGGNFWGTIWPLLIVGFGAMFFVGMFAGGRSVAGLAIPGSIFTGIGLMMFVQNLTNHWESWAYSWTVILMSVGVGIMIMGWYSGNREQRESGWSVIKVGVVLFIIFAGFFEMIFNSFAFSRFLFPAALILLGLYLVLARSGLIPGRSRASDEASSMSVKSDVEEK